MGASKWQLGKPKGQLEGRGVMCRIRWEKEKKKERETKAKKKKNGTLADSRWDQGRSGAVLSQCLFS